MKTAPVTISLAIAAFVTVNSSAFAQDWGFCPCWTANEFVKVIPSEPGDAKVNCQFSGQKIMEDFEKAQNLGQLQFNSMAPDVKLLANLEIAYDEEKAAFKANCTAKAQLGTNPPIEREGKDLSWWQARACMASLKVGCVKALAVTEP